MACAILGPTTVQLTNRASALGLPANIVLQTGQPKRNAEVQSHPGAKPRNISCEVDNNPIQLIPNFKEFLAFLLSHGIPQVRSILMHQDHKLLRVFIVVEKYDPDVNEKIYDQEERIIDVFTNLDFDFTISSQASPADPQLETVLSR